MVQAGRLHTAAAAGTHSRQGTQQVEEGIRRIRSTDPVGSRGEDLHTLEGDSLTVGSQRGGEAVVRTQRQVGVGTLACRMVVGEERPVGWGKMGQVLRTARRERRQIGLNVISKEQEMRR